jgi:hypothetical protein
MQYPPSTGGDKETQDFWSEGLFFMTEVSTAHSKAWSLDGARTFRNQVGQKLARQMARLEASGLKVFGFQPKPINHILLIISFNISPTHHWPMPYSDTIISHTGITYFHHPSITILLQEFISMVPI